MAGILIIAHAPLASALRECAKHVYGDDLARVAAVDVAPDADPAETLKQAKEALSGVISANGALILTDIFGATPSNIATRLTQADELRGRVRLLAGVNLPMLIRAVGYRGTTIDQLAQTALAGGGQGLLQIGSTAVQNQNPQLDPNAKDRYHHQQ
ncbi:MAG: PTS sugar transporter subunit IIA [Candidatus Protistobacter heckmanni]|nr:PTS sugar transporter subunit IIA [Candidatus Protistobacter heckmanni]